MNNAKLEPTRRARGNVPADRSELYTLFFIDVNKSRTLFIAKHTQALTQELVHSSGSFSGTLRFVCLIFKSALGSSGAAAS